VAVERRGPGGTWTRAALLTAAADRAFTGGLAVRRGDVLRAVSGADASLPWTVA
jgi:hypothetical protein